MGVLKSFGTFWNPLAVEFLNNLFLIYSYFFRIFLLWGVWKKYSKNQKPLALEFFHLLFYFFIFKIINWIFSSVCFWKLFKTPISIIFCRIKFYLKYPYVDLILIAALPLPFSKTYLFFSKSEKKRSTGRETRNQLQLA